MSHLAEKIRKAALSSPFDHGLFALLAVTGWLTTSDTISDARYGSNLERRMFLLFVAEALEHP